jgi:hypothetical protein
MSCKTRINSVTANETFDCQSINSSAHNQRQQKTTESDFDANLTTCVLIVAVAAALMTKR